MGGSWKGEVRKSGRGKLGSRKLGSREVGGGGSLELRIRKGFPNHSISIYFYLFPPYFIYDLPK
jgi:hypothetical protein